jgi:hypothetical protein
VTRPGRGGAIAYWSLAAVLTVLGFLDLIAIGAPFFLTGVAMLAAGPWRRDRAVLWPALVAVWAFVAGYVLVAPLGCTSSSGAVPALRGAFSSPVPSHTVCTNILGIDYSGTGLYNPSLLPGLLAGFAAALIAAVLTRMLFRRSRSRAAPAT